MSDYQSQPGHENEDPDEQLPSYPEYPAADGIPEQAAPPPPQQPATIWTAVRLMWAGAGLSAVSLTVTLATLDSLRSHLRKQVLDKDSGITAANFDTVYHSTIIAAVIVQVIAIGLWLWMAWKNGEGRSWARIVSTVLAVLNLISSVYEIFVGRSLAISSVLSSLNLVIAATILVFLWNRESSAFYAATSRRHSEFGG